MPRGARSNLPRESQSGTTATSARSPFRPSKPITTGDGGMFDRERSLRTAPSPSVSDGSASNRAAKVRGVWRESNFASLASSTMNDVASLHGPRRVGRVEDAAVVWRQSLSVATAPIWQTSEEWEDSVGGLARGPYARRVDIHHYSSDRREDPRAKTERNGDRIRRVLRE